MNDVDFTKLINESKLTVEEMANAFMVSKPTIERWAKGTNLPHPIVRKAIADYLKVD